MNILSDESQTINDLSHSKHQLSLLILAAQPVQAASTRYRIAQYIDQLEKEGISCSFFSFISPAAFKILHQKNRSKWQVGWEIFKGLTRYRGLGRALRQADVVWIEREAASIGPPVLEWLAYTIARKPIIVDLDDALYAGSRTSDSYGRVIDWLKFYHKTEKLIGQADFVICGNREIENYVRQLHNQTRTARVPTSVDMTVYRPPQRERRAPLKIGWIGSHSTSRFLNPLWQVLEDLSHNYAFEVKLVGFFGEIPDHYSFPVTIKPWRLAHEVEDFQSLDIGVYPLPDTEIARGKSGFKAIQYMAVGIPCVASPVGITEEIVEHGTTGFLAHTAEEWHHFLEKLLLDDELREKLGCRARSAALQKFDAHHWGKKLAEYIEAVR